MQLDPGTAITDILIDASTVKGADALADPDPASEREDKRPLTARVEEQISELVNAQRAVPKTNDQLAAINARIPGMLH